MDEKPSQKESHSRKRPNERKGTNICLHKAYEEWALQKETYEVHRKEFRLSEGLSSRDFRDNATHGDFAKHLLESHCRFCEFCRKNKNQTPSETFPTLDQPLALHTVFTDACTQIDAKESRDDDATTDLPHGHVHVRQAVVSRSKDVQSAMVQKLHNMPLQPIGQSTPDIALKPVAITSGSKPKLLKDLTKQFAQTVSPIPVSTPAGGNYELDSDEGSDTDEEDLEGNSSYPDESMLVLGEELCNETAESEVFPPEQMNHQEMEQDESIAPDDESGEDDLAAIDYEKCIVSLTKILDLLKSLHGNACTYQNCALPLKYEWSAIGTSIIFSWGCENGHKCGKWYSQERYCKMFTGNIQFPSAVTISGNNFLAHTSMLV